MMCSISILALLILSCFAVVSAQNTSAAPSAVPTSKAPSPFPTARPSAVPTKAPSPFPTARPSAVPTTSKITSGDGPTKAPSPFPTARPSAVPTKAPSPFPTARPSAVPTTKITSGDGPTKAPSPFPTPGGPTWAPTNPPVATVPPTGGDGPTWAPTNPPVATVPPTASCPLDCEDKTTGKFQIAGVGRKSCAWAVRVPNKKKARCALPEVASNCCKTCCTLSPTPAPVPLPTPLPTSSPTECQLDDCNDVVGKFQIAGVRKKQDCKWAVRIPSKKDARCALPEVALNCCKSCCKKVEQPPIPPPSTAPSEHPSPAPSACSEEKKVSIVEFCINGDLDKGFGGDDVEVILRLKGKDLSKCPTDYTDGQCHRYRHTPVNIPKYRSMSVGLIEFDDVTADESVLAWANPSKWYSPTCETYEIMIEKEFKAGGSKRSTVCFSGGATIPVNYIPVGLNLKYCSTTNTYTYPESVVWFVKVEPRF